MKTFLHKPQTVRARRVLFQIHLWLGVIVGLYVLVVSVTGAALVFRIDMQRAMFPNLFYPRVEGVPAEPAALLASIERAYPNHRISGIDAPTTARPTVLAYVARGREFLTVLVDPVGAQVLGELPDRSLLRMLQDLHFDLLAGRIGRVLNGIGAFCLLAMCVTGIVIWWPGIASWPRAFSVDMRRGWKRINFDLHSAVGIWTVTFVSIWAITGVYFAFPSQFRAAVNSVSPLTVARAPLSNVAMRERQPRPTWSALIEEARRQMPGHPVARVVIPATDEAAFQVLFADTAPTPVGTTELRSIYLDQYTGVVLQEPARSPRTAGDVVMAWVGPLHVGSFGGIFIKVAWLLLGLAPPLLFMSGIIMWWNRVVRERWTRLTARTPAARDVVDV